MCCNTASTVTYPRLSGPGLAALSSINIIIWLLNVILSGVSIGIAASNYGGIFVFDFYGACGTLDYLIAGILGAIGAKQKASGLLISSLVFSVFSLFTAIGGLVVNLAWHNTYFRIPILDEIHWVLMGINIIAFIINIAQISVISVGLCNQVIPQPTVILGTQMQLVQQPQYGKQQYNQPTYATPFQYPAQEKSMPTPQNTSNFASANFQPSSNSSWQPNYSAQPPSNALPPYPQQSSGMNSGLPRARY